MRYLTLEPPHEANREENGGEWEVVGELKEIADEPETAKKSAQNGQESEKAAEDGQTPDSAEPPAEVAESTAESVSEEEEEPKKKRGRRKKEKRGNKKNDGENDQDRQSAGVSEEVIRYNVRKLKKLGYIREQDGKYEPTERIVRLKYNAK